MRAFLAAVGAIPVWLEQVKERAQYADNDHDRVHWPTQYCRRDRAPSDDSYEVRQKIVGADGTVLHLLGAVWTLSSHFPLRYSLHYTLQTTLAE